MRDALLQMHSAFVKMAEAKDVLQDTHGNLSFRYSDDEVLIKPSGVPYQNINISNICRVKIIEDSYSVIDNGFKPSVDLPHHMAIYLKNPEIRSICHTHSPYVVAHAISYDYITCCTTEQADYFGHEIECLQYKDLYSWGADVARWFEFYRNHAKIYDEEVADFVRKAVIMRHHGALTFAKDPNSAVNLAIQLENVARKNVLAGMLNVQLLDKHKYALPKEEIRKWHRRYNESYGQR